VPLLVHLAPEGALRSILRAGIRQGPASWAGPPRRGVFCMPVLRDFQVSHQWLRELRRRGPQQLYAVHFRVPDGEPAWVGHYGSPKARTTVGEAIGEMMRLSDPRGWELVLPRPVRPRELHAVRAVRQVVGWRFSPGAKGRRPCGCAWCQRGERSGRRLRDPALDPRVRPRGRAR
jgi:hypothetical protein